MNQTTADNVHPRPALLTVAELARLTKLSTDKLYELARRRRIPSVRCGRAVRFDADEVIAALTTTATS